MRLGWHLLYGLVVGSTTRRTALGWTKRSTASRQRTRKRTPLDKDRLYRMSLPHLELWYWKILNSVDQDLVVVRRLLRSSGSFGFERYSLDASFGVPYAICGLCKFFHHLRYANSPHITYLSSYINFHRPALDDATSNEFENPNTQRISRATL